MQRFEYEDDKSKKFWAVKVDRAELTVHFGKIGTNGQMQTKSFETADKALGERDRLIREKVGKGYIPLDSAGAPAISEIDQLRDLLKRWNNDLLKDEDIEELVDESFLAGKWLGRPPASHADIMAAETRLSTSLPQSYKDFLTTCNGWVYPGDDMNFPGPLRPAHEICWFRDEDADWIDAWTDPEIVIPDAQYFVYGEAQDCVDLRREYLVKCLKISDSTEGGVYLLNPEIKTPDGEWEAWHFSNEMPGATRSRSFKNLIKQQRALLKYYRE